MLNRNLEIFLRVAEYGSITRAAKTLYITQPAASNAISKLEAELNVKLFFRDKRNGLILTDVGQKILLLAKQMEDLDNRIAQTAYQENHFVETYDRQFQGRNRKYYTITDAGRQYLAELTEEWERYRTVVDDIVKGGNLS